MNKEDCMMELKSRRTKGAIGLACMDTIIALGIDSIDAKKILTIFKSVVVFVVIKEDSNFDL